ncbi:unnamed protein product [Arabis nemorensis]|uniref:Uncharacterized protein n=1 Tax=Arabis nemorensis TaxID=586526 RepID=A0A565B6Z7_9BRAS|nr:unnamed protein product [Arabis nemorensis]
MVRATVLKVGDIAVEGVPSNKAKGVKMALEPPMNSAQRRKLGDITNLQNQKANQHQQSLLLSSSEYAEKLQKAMLNPFFFLGS